MTTQVLYIGGSGRTGSTFLSMLLSQNDDMHNVGQIRDFSKSMRRNSFCTCKAKLRDCDYWSAVLENLKIKRPLLQLADGYTAFRKDVMEHRDWADADLQARFRVDHIRYLKQVGKLYAAARDMAGGRMLVDSSKSPELAYAMVLCETITPYTINLVRDPRAVAISWAKRRGMDEEGTDDYLRKRAREWQTRQDMLGIFAQLTPDRFMTLPYEELTAAPRAMIAKILGWAGRDTATDNFSADDQATVTWDGLHLCPPINESILKARHTDITIRAAESWRDENLKHARDVVEQTVFPAAERYGYAR